MVKYSSNPSFIGKKMRFSRATAPVQASNGKSPWNTFVVSWPDFALSGGWFNIQ